MFMGEVGFGKLTQIVSCFKAPVGLAAQIIASGNHCHVHPGYAYPICSCVQESHSARNDEMRI